MNSGPRGIEVKFAHSFYNSFWSLHFYNRSRYALLSHEIVAIPEATLEDSWNFQEAGFKQYRVEFRRTMGNRAVITRRAI